MKENDADVLTKYLNRLIYIDDVLDDTIKENNELKYAIVGINSKSLLKIDMVVYNDDVGYSKNWFRILIEKDKNKERSDFSPHKRILPYRSDIYGARYEELIESFQRLRKENQERIINELELYIIENS